MSAKPENVFRGAIHRHLDNRVYQMKTNNPYVSGIPDDWYSAAGGDLWVEYKFIVIPKRADTVIDVADLLTALQREWLLGRYGEGRTVAVIVGSREGGVIFPGTSWQCSLPASKFRLSLSSRSEIALWIQNTLGVV